MKIAMCALQLLLSGLFMWLALKEVQGENLLQHLGKADLPLNFASFIVALVSVGLISEKYYRLLLSGRFRRSRLNVFKTELTSRFYAVFVPWGVGKDLVRWVKLTKGSGGKTLVFIASIFERAYAVSLLVFSGFLAAALDLFPVGKFAVLAPILWVLCGIFIVLLILLHLFSLSFLQVLQFLRGKLQKHYQAPLKAELEQMLQQMWQGGNLVWLIGLSLLWQLAYFFRMQFIFISLGVAITPLDVLWISSLVLLLQMLPVSFLGIGLREGAFSFFLVGYGYPEEIGISVGLLFFVQILAIALIGGILEWLGLFSQKRQIDG